MAVLLLRLSGPMQSWGTRSRFDDRDTERFPSKSGVIGLICAALGRPRDVPVADLAALRMGARADLPGRLETDYQTSMGVPTASGNGSRTLTSRRHYLADAAFLVGLEEVISGGTELLSQIDAALRAPVWPLSLGRKALVPTEPIWMPGGLLEDAVLEEALMAAPWLGAVRGHRRRGPQLPESLAVEWESPSQQGVPRRDVPVSFEKGSRLFDTRYVIHSTIGFPSNMERAPEEPEKVEDAYLSK